MKTKKLEYKWTRENSPDFTEYTCIYKDTPCLMKFCPAWRSAEIDKGWGRCLLVPGYDPDDE